MDKITLYRFFAGEASENEKSRIKAWLEEDEAHHQQLLDERACFDAMLLADDKALEQRRPASYLLRRIGVQAARWAAVLVLAFAASYWLLEHRQEAVPREAVNVVSVPLGQRTELMLADGTKVYLNAGSTLSYPSAFGQNGRQVELDGEAYFEVTRDEGKPFVVHTQMCDVEVLGTKFNVEAYSEQNAFSAALMEGRVKVGNNYRTADVVYLAPNERVKLKGGELDVERIDDYDVYRWREGLYCFRYKSFADILKDLEKYFDIEIRLENPRIAGIVLTGKFRIPEGLDFILKVLQLDVEFSYSRDIEHNIVYIQ